MYLNGFLVGERPSGCDGWWIRRKDGYLTSFEGMIYPPIWSDYRHGYVNGDIEESRRMFAQAEKIIDEYNRDKTY